MARIQGGRNRRKLKKRSVSPFKCLWYARNRRTALLYDTMYEVTVHDIPVAGKTLGIQCKISLPHFVNNYVKLWVLNWRKLNDRLSIFSDQWLEIWHGYLRNSERVFRARTRQVYFDLSDSPHDNNISRFSNNPPHFIVRPFRDWSSGRLVYEIYREIQFSAFRVCSRQSGQVQFFDRPFRYSQFASLCRMQNAPAFVCNRRSDGTSLMDQITCPKVHGVEDTDRDSIAFMVICRPQTRYTCCGRVRSACVLHGTGITKVQFGQDPLKLRPHNAWFRVSSRLATRVSGARL